MDRLDQRETLAIADESDLVLARNRTLLHARGVGLSRFDETKLVTAVSELSRNMLLYAGGGHVSIEDISEERAQGVRVVFEDYGPGIADVDLALSDGYSTIKGLGMGLPGSRRLVDRFEIESEIGMGTRIVIIKWKR